MAICRPTNSVEAESNYIIKRTFTFIWGCSSVGRASVLQTEGREFDSPQLHQYGALA